MRQENGNTLLVSIVTGVVAFVVGALFAYCIFTVPQIQKNNQQNQDREQEVAQVLKEKRLLEKRFEAGEGVRASLLAEKAALEEKMKFEAARFSSELQAVKAEAAAALKQAQAEMLKVPEVIQQTAVQSNP